MTNLIVEISKYLMILLMALYTYFTFRYFSYSLEGQKKRVCKRQSQAFFLNHLLAYVILYLKTEDAALFAFYGAQVIFFVAYLFGYRLFYRNVSRVLLNNTCMLLSIGLIMMTRLSLDKALRQFFIIVIAAVVTMVIPVMIDHIWQLGKFTKFYAISGLVVLFLVYFVGNESFGAQLSLRIGGISIQPSEFVKISFVFFVAAMFYKSTEFKSIFITTGVAAMHVLILALSKDLGSAFIFFVTYLFLLFVATSNWFYLIAGFFSGGAASVMAYGLFDHVKVRVQAWKNPWADIDNRGYQIAQSLFSIGTGGWFGMGLYQGMPYKIPVVEKDFIFAAIAEELGGIFAICVILVCIGCFVQFMMVASKMQALFYKLVAFGLGSIYIVQVFLTIGGVTKFIPSTGVTLPLMSYGGSSMLSTFILFQIIQGLYILKKNEEEEDEEYEDE